MLISGYVTVIVPVSNGALVVRRCLEAIAAQTYRPLEVVLVDDGSDDPTPAWVRSFRAAHPALPVHVVTQARRGTAGALAAGLARARGEFIAFAHQGDVWAQTKLAEQVQALQAHPQAGFALCAVVEKVGETERLRPAARLGGGALYDAVCLSSLVARRRAIEAVGGFDPLPGLVPAQDLACRLAQAGPGLRVKAPLATCLRPSHTPLPTAAMVKTLARLGEQGRLTPAEVKRAQSRLYAAEGWRSLIADEPDAAAVSFRAALNADPWRMAGWSGWLFAGLDRALFATGLLRPAHGPDAPRAEFSLSE